MTVILQAPKESLSNSQNTSTTIAGAFVALELLGAVGMALVLTTALLASNVKRCTTWYTFCASWIFSCLSYCLLFFIKPSKHFFEINTKNICVTQAALIYSVPTLTALTTLVLLIHSWYNVHFGLSKPPLESHKRVMGVFLFGPFAAWVLMFIGFLCYGLKHPELASSFGLYCTLDNLLPYGRGFCLARHRLTFVPRAKISSLFVIIVTFTTIPVQISLGISLCRNFDRSDTRGTLSVQSLKMVVRVFIFSFLILIGFAEGLIHLLTEFDKPSTDLVLALLPVSGFLIFGVQRDLFQAWKGWMCRLTRPFPFAQLKKSHRRSSTAAGYGPWSFCNFTGSCLLHGNLITVAHVLDGWLFSRPTVLDPLVTLPPPISISRWL
ncbi:hypothetical protein L218DRAFT_1081384 [Marasmius fiardii PR-910]|nr:hypothetical protein L218DRAFT_1081384 [Marasmius fiardii PR-910]